MRPERLRGVTDAPHWTEPGAHPRRRRHPPDPAAAADGRAAGGERLRDRDRGGADPRRRSAWRSTSPASSSTRCPLASIGWAVSDITHLLVTHVHRDHYTQAVTIRREVGWHREPRARRQGHPGRRTRRVRLRPDGPADPPRRRRPVAAGWADAMSGQVPDPSMSGSYPDTWLDGDQHLTARHPHDRGGLDARPHPGALRARRPRRRPGTRRRPRAADHHPVDRVRAGVRRPAARRLPHLPRQGPRDARPAAAARARCRSRPRARPHRRARRPPRRAARALPGLRARRADHGVRRRG